MTTSPVKHHPLEEEEKPNLTTEIFTEYLRKTLTKEQQEEYNQMMKRCHKDGIVMDVGKVFEENE